MDGPSRSVPPIAESSERKCSRRFRRHRQPFRAGDGMLAKAAALTLNNASASDSHVPADRKAPPPADARAREHQGASVPAHPHARGIPPHESGAPMSSPAAIAADANEWTVDAWEDPCIQPGDLSPSPSKPTTRLPTAEANQDAMGIGGSTGTTGKSRSRASRSERRLAQAPFTGSFQRKPASLARWRSS